MTDPLDPAFNNAVRYVDNPPPSDAERQAIALERIAESLDAIATLLAAPAALKATGVQPNEPDADGWIAWTGGQYERPDSVPAGLNDTYVYVRFRDGEETTDPAKAQFYDWRDTDSGWNIIAYRIHKEGTAE